jgi:hypothetical protein
MQDKELYGKLRNAVILHMYAFHKAMSGEPFLEQEELEDAAFREYRGGIDYSCPQIVYPFLKNYTDSLVGLIISAYEQEED